MTFYIQTGENGKITDIITYPHEGYTEIELPAPLPVGIIGGAYELRDNLVIYRPEWDENEKIRHLEEQLAEMRKMLLNLTEEPTE